MFTHIKFEPYIKSFITINATSLIVVETFACLGSTLISDGFLNVEIPLNIPKTSVANGVLEKQ